MLNLPGYDLKERLHYGNHSVLYRAERLADRKPVILKTLQRSYPTAEEIARLTLEYDLLRSLDVPHTVRVYALEHERGKPVIVFEDGAGLALSQAFPSRLPLDDFLRLAIELATALSEIHTRQIIHKDINPSNVIVYPSDGRLKLIDFGIASLLPREEVQLTSPTMLEGTLPYIAPEQTGRMNRAVDQRSDLYSLGATLYQLLTGQPPFITNDPLEMIHSHLARTPRAPRQVSPSVPVQLSLIIMKLLEKNAEDRYQSAAGLRADLQRCLEDWEEQQSITPFELGLNDKPDQLRISQKLYGREAEVQTLLQTFERVAEGGVGLTLVYGYSGVGKSSLIHELYRPLVERRGYVISGKCDQLKRTTPYAALIQALQDLVRQLLTETSAEIARWREALLAALGTNAGVLIEMLPELELIIGAQPPAPALPPQEAQNRFIFTFSSLMRVLAHPAHPLVLVLDDLQWIDNATLNLLTSLLANPETLSLLVVGAYRDHEVPASHPLLAALGEIERASVQIDRIALRPLDAHGVAALLADTLGRPPDDVAELAQVVSAKTNGNPFFVGQFVLLLHQQGLLSIDADSGDWRWDTAAIEALEITPNVVDLMINKLGQLPAATQRLLNLAACIGNRFDLAILALISNQEPRDVLNDLWPALMSGLLIPLDDQYRLSADSERSTAVFRFLHDRVQQAAYSLIAADERTRAHLLIGRQWLQTLADDVDEHVFDLVNHLNLGHTLITDTNERLQLAELNLLAAQRAKSAIAYDSALRYLDAALDLLSSDERKADRGLALALLREHAECAYLLGQWQAAEASLEAAAAYAQDAIEHAELGVLRAAMYTTQGRYYEALVSGAQTLRLLGLELPAPDETIDVVPELVRIQGLLGDRPIPDLLNLPPMTDPALMLATLLMTRLAAAAYFVSQDLFTLLVLNMVGLSLEHGNSSYSSYAYTIYGALLCMALGQYEAGYQFGELAFAVDEQLGSTHLRHRTYHSFGTFISHWTQPVTASIDTLRLGFQYGQENGDLIYAGYCGNVVIYDRMLSGHQLGDVFSESERYLDFVLRAKDQDTADNLIVTQRFIRSLQGRTTSPTSLDDDDFSEAEFIAHLSAIDMKLPLGWYSILKARSCYLFGEYAQALAAAKQAQALLPFSIGLYQVPEHTFYYALTLAALYPDTPAAQQPARLEELQAMAAQLHTWAEHCPANHRHKALLVAAELERISGAQQAALDLYEQALDAAASQGFVQHEALAAELAARLYIQRGKQRIASVYLQDARYAYARWGATAKVAALDAAFPQLVRLGQRRGSIDLNQTIFTRTESTGADLSSFDLRTVLKASQALSGEIRLPQLLETLLRVVMESAGAQRALLLLPADGAWFIEAESLADGPEPELLQSIPIDAAIDGQPILPLSVINYALRTRQPLLLDDALHRGRFTQDSYVQAHAVRSVLCLPLINQGALAAILYLENRLTEAVFTPNHLELLKLIAAQAAISIENARLYTTIQSSEEKFRKLFEDSRDAIFISLPDGSITDVNDECVQLLGYSHAELLHMNAAQLYVDLEDRRRLRDELDASGSLREYEIPMQRKDGRILECQMTVSVRRGPSGEPLAYQGIIRDMTEQRRAERERLQFASLHRELSIAQEMQQRLLVAASPEWADLEVLGFNAPAREVGGDLYAFHMFAADGPAARSYAVALGDVSGKGVPAALLMAISLSSLRSTLDQHLAPNKVLSALNRVILPYTGGSRQNCALAYVELSATGRAQKPFAATFANAGAIPPLIRRIDGALEWLDASGLPLGLALSSNHDYQQVSALLGPGDLLLLLSDGVVEARNDQGELFGFERLEALVTALPYADLTSTMAYMRRELEAFTGNVPPHDDVTIVLVRPPL